MDGMKMGNAMLTGLSRIPCDIKVLRILGRGACLDDIDELSGISKTTMDFFFHEWTKRFREDMCAEHIRFPETPEEIMLPLNR
jgi:hypothetical protein